MFWPREIWSKYADKLEVYNAFSFALPPFELLHLCSKKDQITHPGKFDDVTYLTQPYYVDRIYFAYHNGTQRLSSTCFL
jgi:hypothetical protein